MTAAVSDFAEIWAYVATDAVERVATRSIGKIEAACESLCHFPCRDRRGSDWRQGSG